MSPCPAVGAGTPGGGVVGEGVPTLGRGPHLPALPRIWGGGRPSFLGAPPLFFMLQDPPPTMLPPRCCWALLLLCAPAFGGGLLGWLGFGTPPQEGTPPGPPPSPPPGPPSPPHVPFEMTTGDERFQAEGAQWELSPLDACHRQVWPRGSPWVGNGGAQGVPPPWGATLGCFREKCCPPCCTFGVKAKLWGYLWLCFLIAALKTTWGAPMGARSW